MERGTLPELQELKLILTELEHPAVRVEVLHSERYRGRDYPVHAITLGIENGPPKKTLLLMAGVHGLERIGSQVLIAYLHTLASRLRWDGQLDHLLSRARIVLIPILNPIGILLHRRSNARGVDLMRNAPVDSRIKASPLSLYRGQTLSPRLPYFRGKGLEPELQALTRFCAERLFPSHSLIALDIHSGFGGKDQLWFPYAHSRRFFPETAEIMALFRLLDQSHPNHCYVAEPQSRNYTVHGDLWDHLYRIHRAQNPTGTFLPLTLELASWAWIRKNPRQFATRLGLFHPIKAHRVRRVLRRHMGLLDFLTHVTASPQGWTPLSEPQRSLLEFEARKKWPELE